MMPKTMMLSQVCSSCLTDCFLMLEYCKAMYTFIYNYVLINNGTMSNTLMVIY